MRSCYFIILIFLFSFSCRNNKNPVNNSDDKTENTSVNSTNETKSSDQKFKVTGLVTFSRSYCGGARPTDEMLREITAPHPRANTKYFIRKGENNNLNEKIYMTIQTDEKGKLDFKIPAGDYIIIEENRMDSTYIKSILTKYKTSLSNYSAVDTACLTTWVKGYLFKLKVIDKDVDNVSWNESQPCFFAAPCVHYTGPYPP